LVNLICAFDQMHNVDIDVERKQAQAIASLPVSITHTTMFTKFTEATNASQALMASGYDGISRHRLSPYVNFKIAAALNFIIAHLCHRCAIIKFKAAC